MKIDFIRFKATDNVELQGWLSDMPGKTAVIHIHGRGGNGYENYFLDNLRNLYAKNNVSFFTINNRGHDTVSSFWQGNRDNEWGYGTKLGGGCFEIFGECINDIQGAIDYLKTLGKNRFILQGHSLGGSKVVNYITTEGNQEVIGCILLAPTDMVAWANTDPNHKKYLKKAKELISQGKGEELVGTACWPPDNISLSAQTYPTISEAGTGVDIYGERKGGALLGRIKIPMIIIYGDKDIGIKRLDGSIDKWLKRVNKIKNPNTKIKIIKGALHSFKWHEEELTKLVESFLKHFEK